MDNISALYLTLNHVLVFLNKATQVDDGCLGGVVLSKKALKLVLHACIKYVKLDYHFVRKKVIQGVVVIKFILSYL